jgi:hypothetical protein
MYQRTMSHKTMLTFPHLFATTGSEPAGGAALDQVAIASAGATLFTAALLVLAWGHRSGRLDLLGRWGALAERVSGLPPWAALPSGVASVSLLTAVFGMYWDISLHIDVGRDPGPLANPAHFFILAGLFGIFAAGVLAVVMAPADESQPSFLRLTEGWAAPLGGVLIAACGAFSLTGFPLDDVWHRIFGQDVTLWGPTHLMLIGGAAMALVGMAVLLVEGTRANRAVGRRELHWAGRARRVALTGSLLIGLSTFQAEFDFGVPQFRFLFQPLLIALAAGVALVAARLWLGRGAALGAVGFFLLLRGGLALLVGPVLGEATPHFPLYVAEAIVVELAALWLAPRRPLAFGLVAGALVGTVGLATEWGWSHVFMPIPWPSALFREALLAIPMAIAAGVLGAWIGTRLRTDPRAGGSIPRTAVVLAAVAIAALAGFALDKPSDRSVRAAVTLDDATAGPERTATATVRLTPRDAAQGAEWLTATAWQGGGLVVDRLQRVGPGVYRTPEPVPVHGGWKTLIRLHHGRSLTAVPLYLPDDPAIPAKGVAAPASFTRPFVADHEILQREQKTAPAGLAALAYGAVLAITLALLALLAWGLHRLGAGGPSPGAGRQARRRGGRLPSTPWPGSAPS